MKIAFVYTSKCHPTVQAFADSIHAEPYCIKASSLGAFGRAINSFLLTMTMPKFEVYFIESAMSLFVPTIKRKLFREKNIIIFRANDGLFGEKDAAYLTYSKSHSKNFLKVLVLKYLIKNIDAISTESAATKKDILRWINVPISIDKSYFENRKKLYQNKPDYNHKRFLFIGDYRPPYDPKGIEILIKSFEILEKEKIEVYIVGKNTDKIKTKAKNIHCLGFIKCPLKYYSKCTFAISAAKYETGPITIFEACMAGLIPIFSKNCGHSDIVRKISPELVLESIEPEEVAKRIREIHNLDDKTIKKLSARARKYIKNKFKKEEQLNMFRRNFWKMVNEVKKR